MLEVLFLAPKGVEAFELDTLFFLEPSTTSASKDSILDFFGLDNVGGSVEIAEWIDLPGRDFCCTPVVDDILCLLVRLELGKSEVA